MAHVILAETTASVSELKKNPMATVAASSCVSARVTSSGSSPTGRRTDDETLDG